MSEAKLAERFSNVKEKPETPLFINNCAVAINNTETIIDLNAFITTIKKGIA